jgi:RNA polymerase sigma-70 factor (ECF subfamily)
MVKCMDMSLILWKPSVGERIPSHAEASAEMPASSKPLAVVWNDVSPGLSRTAIALGVPRDRLDDLMQEVWLAAWQDGPQSLDDVGWRRWLYRVTVNRCRLEHRQKGRWKRALETLVSKWTTNDDKKPENPAESRELNTAVEAALGQLPPVLREVVVLRYFSGFDSREIGDMLRISDSTVRSHLRAARKQLALVLAAWDPKE